MITDTVLAYIDDSANVQADNLISVTTTDNATIDASVGAYAVAFGVVGASIGASVQTSTVNNMVSAYIDAPVTVMHGDIMVSSGSTVSVTGTAVATSVAAAVGAFSGSGDNSMSAIGGTVEAYVGTAGVLSIPLTGDVTIQATSSQHAEADGDGVAVSVGGITAAIGVSLGTATIDGTTQANMSGTLMVGHSLTVLATDTGTADATLFALAGGVGAVGVSGGPRHHQLQPDHECLHRWDGRDHGRSLRRRRHRRGDGAHEYPRRRGGGCVRPVGRGRRRDHPRQHRPADSHLHRRRCRPLRDGERFH